MEKKIYVSEKNKAHLRKVFGCSTMMVCGKATLL